MAANLVSTILQSLSPEIVGKLASNLGLEQQAAQKGISAAIPGVLASLANAVSGHDGAQKIGAALSHVDDIPTRGGDIARSVLESGRSVLDSGGSVLSSLLGNNVLETLASAVAQYAGFSPATAKRLLGFLTPIVLGFLRREQLSSGLDNRGLAGMLLSQKSAIERNMPQGFAGLLPDAAPRSSGGMRDSAPDASYRPAAARASASGGSRNWVYWLLPALIIAGAALYLLPAGDEARTAQDINKSTMAQSKPAPSPAMGGMPSPTPVGASKAAGLQNDILTTISRLQVALNRIKDPASAQASVAEIRDISGQFAKLKSIAQELSPDERKAVAAAVAAKMPDLNTIFERIGTEINQSGEAKPAMDTLKIQLANLSKA